MSGLSAATGKRAAAFGLPWLVLPLAVAGVVAALWPSFSGMAHQWWTSATFSHGFLIAPVSLVLAWRQRRELAAIPPRAAGLPLIGALPVLGIWLTGRLLDIDALHQFAAVGVVVLTVWAVLGHVAARVLAFPLGYLFLMVPFGEFLVPSLMRLTADAAVLGVRLSGVPVFQDGYLFSLPSGDFEVIKACSGIRFLVATVAAGVLFAGLMFRSWRRRLIFLALCFIVPVVANLVRAYGVVMIVHLSDMRFAAGGDHIVYGTIFYAAVLIGMFVVAARWAEPAAPVRSFSAAPAWTPVWRPLLSAVAMVVVAAGTSVMATQTLVRAVLEAKPLAGLPAPATGWSGPLAAADDWQPRFPGALREDAGRYRNGPGEEVDVYLVSFGPAAGEGDLTSSTNRLYNPDRWRLQEDESGVRDAGGPVREQVVRAGEADGRVIWSWYLVNGQRELSASGVKRRELTGYLSGAPMQKGLVALSARFTEDPDSARERLARFISQTCAGQAGCLLAP